MAASANATADGTRAWLEAAAVTEEQRREAVRSCFRRCICAGQCGRSHRNWREMGRCASEEGEGAARLRAIPAALTGMTAEPGHLVAVCDRCQRGLEQRRPAPASAAVQDELPLEAD